MELSTLDTQSYSNNPQLNSSTTFPVSFGKSVAQNGTPVENKPFSDILDVIRTGAGIIDTITAVRECTDKDQRNNIKKRLPYFNMGLFRDGRRKDEYLISTRFMILDFDDLGNRLEPLKNQLTKNQSVYMAFTSPSGDGLKVVLQFDREISNPDEYKSIYSYYAERFTQQYKIQWCKTHDASRACFLSYDPDVYFNPHSVPVTTNINQLPVAKQRKAPKRDDLLKVLDGVSEGGRNTAATQLAGMFVARGFDSEFTMRMMNSWNNGNATPLPEYELQSTVAGVVERYQTSVGSLPIEITVMNGAYYKQLDEKTSQMLASFVITPKELLVHKDGDCMRCTITTANGVVYEDILIENTDWHTKIKFLKAIKHSDCVFLGSESELQALCYYVGVTNEIPRKTGTKVIGLHDSRWVVEDMNITKDGIAAEQTVVAYDKGGDAFYHKIGYQVLNDVEYQSCAAGFYADILNMNEHKVIVPFVGWMFTTPVKEIIRREIGSYPSMFVHGGQGSGKTTTAMMFMRLVGYKDAVPNKCDMKPFPMLKLLSATNGVPVFLDEFKIADMKDDAVKSLQRYIREAYTGEMESKGREDQTTVDYQLSAPITVMGEWSINQPAILERVLISRFANKVKKNKNMQQAYERIDALQLEGFMPKYITYCLGRDIPEMLKNAKSKVLEHFGSTTVAPRIINNLSVMVLGIELFLGFGVGLGITVPGIDVGVILNNQLQEITGSTTGFVRSAVDQLIEELGIMYSKNFDYEMRDRKIMWHKTIRTKDSSGQEVDALAIKFSQVFPEFKEYAKRTGYEGDLLDKSSYLKLFEETDYVIAKDRNVVGLGRCLCVDTEKAKAAGIDLDGYRL